MMTADELRERCTGIRPGTCVVDDALVGLIEADVEVYRGFLTTRPTQLPPAALVDRLPLMGWLVYEASLDRLWEVDAGFGAQAGARGDASRAAAALICRIADAGRALPWPEFAPRALGAIRAEALVESKRDTEAGYDAAWILHQEARGKHKSYLATLGDDPAHDRVRLDFDEVLLQLALAETGTACRTAERVIGLWAEELEKDEPAWTAADSVRWTQRMFRELSDGAEIGEHALAVAARIEERHGLVHRVGEERMALVTSYRNPAIMTCRALLLIYSMCPEMKELRPVPQGYATWEDFQAGLRRRFDVALSYLRRPVWRENGEEWSLLGEHARAIVQICLHLALLTPGHRLQHELRVDGGLVLDRLDDAAVDAMCRWLATVVDDRQRGDANVIGSASKPSFIQSVEDCREDPGASAGYRDWRREWFRLDRYADRPRRRERITRVLDLAER